MRADPELSPRARRRLDPALRRLALVVVVGSMMTSLDAMIVNIAIVTLDHQFHSPLSTTQWVVTGYLLALSMTIPITGWAVERFGTKPTWVVSLVLFMVGSVLSGFAWSITSLIVFRVLQGMGGGLLLPAGQTMLARAAGTHQMGRMASVIAIPAMFSPVLGPVLGGLIISHLNWRWMFFINVPVCTAAIVLAVRMLPADGERQRGRHLDVLGLALLSPGLATLAFGLSQAAGPGGLTSPRVAACAGTGALLLIAFCRHALRTTRTPLVDIRLFGLRSFRAASWGLFGYTATVLSMDFVLSLYLQTVRGQNPLSAGLLIAPWGVGAACTMVLSMRVVDRRGPRSRVLVGMVPVLAGAVIYSQVGPNTSLQVLGAAMFVVGLGHGLVLPALTATIYRELVRSAVPAASMLFNIVARVAGSFGTATAAVVLQIQIRLMMPRLGGSGSLSDVSGATAPEARERLATAFGRSFWWALVLGAVVLVAALRIPRMTRMGTAGEADGDVAARSRDGDPGGRKAS
ncbi:MAG TPA: DHA2 family efflux MFS transporter permease subunit [Mycobacteriales bacterium]|nr:DHA2 family efflux MFS transporter permease subunit [Mycobacteriales bacterium]